MRLKLPPSKYFVEWAKFSFEFYGDGKRNTVNWLNTDVLNV